MTNIEEILNKQVSFQGSAFAPLSDEIPIKDVLEIIKEEKLSAIVRVLRNLLAKGDADSYNIKKKQLPGVTFSGTFQEARRRDNIKDYNRIIVLDIDKLTSQQLHEYKKILNSDPFVFAFWESPSQKGIKGLIPINYEIPEEEIDVIHRIAFKKLVDYFNSEYGIELDESGSDTTRLCFLSADPNITIKTECKLFNVHTQDVKKYMSSVVSKSQIKGTAVKRINRKDALYNSRDKNSPQNRFAMKSILKYLTKRGLSITSTYDNWYRVAYAIANSFTYDIGKKYFIDLCRLDGEKHNETESINLLINCYETTKSEITFSTIYHFAQELGYKPKKIGDSSEGD